MIQVCSSCGTRWNVHDRQRMWCPRCHGTLLAPSADQPGTQWNQRPPSAPAGPAGQQGRPAPPRLPAGYRWIAVRPGNAPPPRRRRRPLGPTPRYAVIPQWGLVDGFGPGMGAPTAPPRTGPSPTTVRATLYSTAFVLGAAALVHLIRYVLLMINRSTLLNPWVAATAIWLGLICSLAAIIVIIACAVVMTRWLIARRAAVFAHLHRPETRSVRALWAGCLVPFVNLAWAPVYVVEMATAEDDFSRLRKPVIVWWVLWVLSTAVSVFATATSFATDAQGIADNTLTMTFAYLLALAAVVAIARVFFGFDRKPVERPAHRWVIVPTDKPVEPSTPESGVAVEPAGQEPAA